MEDKSEEVAKVVESEKQKPLKILIVESNRQIADFVEEILEGEGHQVTAFVNKEEALEELRRKKEKNFSFDWVITNRGFAAREQSEMDGIKLAEKIRDENLGNPYVTMLTRSAEHYSQEQLKKMGIHYAIGKDFIKKELVRLVSSVRQFRTQSGNPQTA